MPRGMAGDEIAGRGNKLLDAAGKAVTLDGTWALKNILTPFPDREVPMKPTRPLAGRTNVRRWPQSHRPRLDALEDRLPPGDGLLGAWLSSWLLGPGWALVDAGLAAATRGDPNGLADGGPEATGTAIVRNEDALPEPAATPSAAPASSVDLPEGRGREARGTLSWSGANADWAADARLPERTLGQLTTFLSGVVPVGDLGAVHPAPRSGGPVATRSPSAGVRGLSGHLGQPAPPGWVRPVTAGAAGPSAAGVSKSQAGAKLAQLPLAFEVNVGQADAAVHFLAHGPGYGLYLTATEAVMVLSQGSGIEGATA